MRNRIENDGYVYLGEFVPPEAKRLLEQMVDGGVRYRLAIIDDIRRAWPWGHHGSFTRIAIFVDPGDLDRARLIQDRVIKPEL